MRGVSFLAMILFLATLLPACAHAVPYTSEMAVGEWTGDWTGDGSASALRVTNPLASPVHVVVACLADSGEVDRWDVDMAAHGSTTVLFQKLAKNWGVNVCHVESWGKR